MTPQAVLEEQKKGSDSTDLALFVRTSSDTIVGWDRKKIVEALIRETNLMPDLAEEIGREVETQILTCHISG